MSDFDSNEILDLVKKKLTAPARTKKSIYFDETLFSALKKECEKQKVPLYLVLEELAAKWLAGLKK